jgi:hypothetical protein
MFLYVETFEIPFHLGLLNQRWLFDAKLSNLEKAVTCAKTYTIASNEVKHSFHATFSPAAKLMVFDNNFKKEQELRVWLKKSYSHALQVGKEDELVQVMKDFVNPAHSAVSTMQQDPLYAKNPVKTQHKGRSKLKPSEAAVQSTNRKRNA